MTEHARIAPSSLHITTPCPGSVLLSEAMPVLPESEEEAEGTAAHWLAYEAGMGRIDLNQAHGFIAPNNVEVTDEMIDAAIMYVDVLGTATGVGEMTIPITRIHETDCKGTPDWWTWTPATKTLKVVDFKFGYRFVEVWENHQLVAYAVGLLDFLGIHDDEAILELTVVQPRSYHPDGPVRTWTVAANKVRAFANTMTMSAHEALSAKPSTRSGPHCLDCKARSACLTFAQTTGGIMDHIGVAVPNLQTPDDVGRELALVQDMRQRLKARETGLEAMAEHYARNHKAVPGFSMQSTMGRLKWLENTTVDEVEAMVGMLVEGGSALKPRALLTPTQAKKLFKGKIGDMIVNQYANRQPGAMKLVRDNLAKLSRVFQK